MSWQPIETAPLTGREMLVYYKNSCGNGRIIKAFYAGKYAMESEEDYAEYCEERDAYFAPEGWYESIDNWDEFSSIKTDVDPTRWMPLPEPPEC